MALTQWRIENGIHASPDDDWILAERELYIKECGNQIKPDRYAYYGGADCREPIDLLDTETANELSRLGYPHPLALAAMPDKDKINVNRWFKARGKKVNLDSAQSEAIAQMDDLTLLDGVDEEMAAKMNWLGIYRFDQLEALNEEERRDFCRKLGSPKFKWHNWKPIWTQRRLSRDSHWPRIPTDAEIGARAGELHDWRSQHNIEGTQEDDWILAERELYIAACGLSNYPHRKTSYQSRVVHDKISGLNYAQATELSRLGFQSTSDLENMKEADKAQVKRWLNARELSIDFD